MANKYNPFRPDKAFPPGMFIGRVDEVEYTEHCLIQTKNGNSRHFIIEGERGIGKTSLCLYEYWLASGQIAIDDGTKLDFVTINISLQETDTWFSILKKISQDFRQEIQKREKYKTMIFAAWDFLTRIEGMGFKIGGKEQRKIEETDLLSAVTSDLIKVILECPDVDGICLLIDEADNAPVSANLGLMCKLITEELTRRNADKLCIGLAGLPRLVGRLRESHESSPRIFHVLSLKPLSTEERLWVLERCMKEASEKNSSPVEITEEAKDLLIDLSEGYPHFLQQFGYCAFEEDDDNEIDRVDVRKSLFKEHGAFDQLGKKYFDQYYQSSGSDDYRRVLHAMAKHSDGWVDRATIKLESQVSKNNVDNALRALKTRKIIVQNDKKRGQYRLLTKSFAVWLNAQNQAERISTNPDEPSLFPDTDF